MFHLVKILFVGFVNKTSSAAFLSVVFFPCIVIGVEIARKLGEAISVALLLLGNFIEPIVGLLRV